MGFTTSRNYRAVEGGKAVRVCVGVRVGRVESLLAPVRLRLTTVPGSASRELYVCVCVCTLGTQCVY